MARGNGWVCRRIRAEPFRFHLDRHVDFVQHAITTKRLPAGLGQAGARQLHFFIAEKGITAAAHVVITWLPRGFVPPQVTILSAKPCSGCGHSESMVLQPRLSGDNVLYWRGDIF